MSEHSPAKLFLNGAILSNEMWLSTDLIPFHYCPAITSWRLKQFKAIEGKADQKGSQTVLIHSIYDIH